MSGGGRSDFASTVKSSTRIVSSPRRDMNTDAVDADDVAEVELEQQVHALLAEHVALGLQLDAARAVVEVQERHPALAAPRVQPPREPVARLGLRPGSRPACAARTLAIASTPSNACGNGSMPCSRRRSSLARRWASRSSAIEGGEP